MTVEAGGLQSFEREIDAIGKTIAEAIDTLRGGKAPVLTGLGVRVEALCRRVAGADGPTARAVQPLMAGVIRTLDELAVEIERYQADLAAKEAGA